MLESTRANMAIDSKWSQVAAQNEPRAIYDGTAQQFAAAEKLLNSKKQIISELQAELRTREAEYTELIEVAHKEDVDLMVKRMHEQFAELLRCCEEELIRIEAVFVEERKELIDKNKKEIMDIYERRRKTEEETMKKRADREEENQKTLLREQSEAQDKYDARKRSLEHSVQQLEQCLQDMNATFELNREVIISPSAHQHHTTTTSHFTEVDLTSLLLLLVVSCVVCCVCGVRVFTETGNQFPDFEYAKGREQTECIGISHSNSSFTTAADSSRCAIRQTKCEVSER